MELPKLQTEKRLGDFVQIRTRSQCGLNLQSLIQDGWKIGQKLKIISKQRVNPTGNKEF